MDSSLIRLLAAAALALLLFWLFRLAMGLRYAKLLREQERRAEEASGRRLVAEAPTHAGELVLFFEAADSFRYGEREIAKAGILGARLILNGRVLEWRARPGAALPEVGREEEHEGRERWDVLLHLGGGGSLEIPCGTLREGVSRDAARRVFEAVAKAISEAWEGTRA